METIVRGYEQYKEGYMLLYEWRNLLVTTICELSVEELETLGEILTKGRSSE